MKAQKLLSFFLILTTLCFSQAQQVVEDKWEVLNYDPFIPPRIGTIAVDGDDIYVAGDKGKYVMFMDNWDRQYPRDIHHGIWHFDGSAWMRIDDYAECIIDELILHNNSLYAAGTIKENATDPVHNFTYYDGSNWQFLDVIMDKTVQCFLSHGDTLYIGTTSEVGYLAGADYTTLFHIQGTVNSLEMYQDQLVIGGDYTAIDTFSANYIASWDGITLSDMNGGMSGPVSALESDVTTLYVGGRFSTAGSIECGNYTTWNGSEWTSLAPHGSCSSLALYRGYLYAGIEAHNTPVEPSIFYNRSIHSVARLYLSQPASPWEIIGTVGSKKATPNKSLVLASSQNGIILGGEFWRSVVNIGSTVGPEWWSVEYLAYWPTIAFDRIAFFDGNQWQGIGTGNTLSGMINNFAIHQDKLYISGGIQYYGDQRTSNLAQWDTQTNRIIPGINWVEDYRGVFTWNNIIGVWGKEKNTPYSLQMNAIHDGHYQELSLFEGDINRTFNTDDGIIFSGSLNIGPVSNYTAFLWDGQAVTALGLPFATQQHSTHIAQVGDDIYAVRGTQIVRIGPTPDETIIAHNIVDVYSMVGHEGMLYVAGNFTTIDGTSISRLGYWDGQNWHQWGNANDEVREIIPCKDYLVVWGKFTTINGRNFNAIARFGGSSPIWSSCGDDFIGEPRIVKNFNNTIFIYRNVWPYSVANLTYWNDSEDTWHEIGDAIDGSVYGMQQYKNHLYLAGTFNEIGGKPCTGFARYSLGRQIEAVNDAKTTHINQPVTLFPLVNDNFPDGKVATISAVDTTNTLGTIKIVYPYDRILYTPPEDYSGDDIMGYTATDNLGNISTGTIYITILPLYVDGGWSGTGLTNSPDDRVFSLEIYQDQLYLGGQFDNVGPSAFNKLAKWNGHVFTSSGVNFNGDILSMDTGVYGLYVGGNFTSPYSKAARVADDTAHELYDSGIDGEVYAVKKCGDRITFGGRFQKVNDEMYTSENIAFYMNYDWSTVNPGLDGFVSALDYSGDNIYVGGHFQRAGQHNANNIALYTINTGWQTMGNGIGSDGWYGAVTAILAVSEDEVYAGISSEKTNYITAAGDSLMESRVYQWDGISWRKLPGSFLYGSEEPLVNTLFMNDSLLYVGGVFNALPVQLQDGTEIEPTIPANSVAVWDGTTWSCLGSGIIGSVHDLIIWNDHLYTGGLFNRAGGVEVMNFAFWTSPEPGAAPQAVDDQFTIYQDSTSLIDLLINDSDPDNEEIRIIQLITDATQGIVAVQEDRRSVHYQASAGYLGEDSFDYVISDAIGRLDTATVTISVISTSVENQSGQPLAFALYQNYPNPFNHESVIAFDLPTACHVKVNIYNTLGKQINILKNEKMLVGRYRITWYAEDDHGRVLPTGVYFCQIRAEEFTAVIKVLLLR